MTPRTAKKGIVIGLPMPREYFETQGSGESDFQIHAGSYHIALQRAGVEIANIVAYSSIMPPTAQQITREEGMKKISHGSEMKVIQAAAHVDRNKGESRATAAIMYGWLFPKNGGPTIGGLVCEYNGSASVQEARDNLTNCLDGLYKSRDNNGKSFSDNYDLKNVRFISESITPEKRFGTALVILAFVNYFVPVIEQNVFADNAVAATLVNEALPEGI
jgi:arginine decarboxylase